MEKTVWVSDSDINGLDTVARISRVDGVYFLEVVNANPRSFKYRLKSALRVLFGNTSIFSFVILSDKDEWVRRIEDGKENSKS